MQFQAFEKGIEVSGQAVYSIIDGFKQFKSLATKYLLGVGIGEKGKDGFVELILDAWYSQEKWLEAFKQISETIGTGVLYNTGLAIPEDAIFPSWINDIESAIKSIDIAYHLNHRKNGIIMFNETTGKMLEGIGHYGYEKVDDKNIIISVCNNPYPCDFDKGILTAMATKFEIKAHIIHDDSKPCRKNNADSCTYIITW